jgi:hypothetical protein
MVAFGEWFYAVVVSSKPVKSVSEAGEDSAKFSDDERFQLQTIAPTAKVIVSRHDLSRYVSAAEYYDGVNQDFNFLAVHAGKTKAEATEMLNAIKMHTGKKFPDAYLRRMRKIYYSPDWD